jgi:hypothetical protein
MRKPLKSPVLASYSALEDAMQFCPGITFADIDLQQVELLETFVVFPNGSLGIQIVVQFLRSGLVCRGTAFYKEP